MDGKQWYSSVLFAWRTEEPWQLDGYDEISSKMRPIPAHSAVRSVFLWRSK